MRKKLDLFLIRSTDILAAALLLILSFPFAAFALLLSALFIGFPPVYISVRIGKGGRPFKHIKIKSLLPGKEMGRIFMEQDRLNRCGKFLRGSHLDEIPELLHIIAGKMSFVGPRPLPAKLLEGLDVGDRHSVRPGWTCTAQIALLRKGWLNQYLQLRLDNIYAHKRSFRYNMSILAATIRSYFVRSELDLSTVRRECAGSAKAEAEKVESAE
ncbi:MAG: sugar transferase [Clostridiales bacterium]|nr:sugar transferase [Clostridiales bacterium]